MPNAIYLISSDGFRDSIELEKYAVTRSDIIKILKAMLLDIGEVLCENSVVIDYENNIIKFDYMIDDMRESDVYYLHKAVLA